MAGAIDAKQDDSVEYQAFLRAFGKAPLEDGASAPNVSSGVDDSAEYRDFLRAFGKSSQPEAAPPTEKPGWFGETARTVGKALPSFKEAGNAVARGLVAIRPTPMNAHPAEGEEPPSMARGVFSDPIHEQAAERALDFGRGAYNLASWLPRAVTGAVGATINAIKTGQVKDYPDALAYMTEHFAAPYQGTADLPLDEGVQAGALPEWVIGKIFEKAGELSHKVASSQFERGLATPAGATLMEVLANAGAFVAASAAGHARAKPKAIGVPGERPPAPRPEERPAAPARPVEPVPAEPIQPPGAVEPVPAATPTSEPVIAAPTPAAATPIAETPVPGIAQEIARLKAENEALRAAQSQPEAPAEPAVAPAPPLALESPAIPVPKPEVAIPPMPAFKAQSLLQAIRAKGGIDFAQIRDLTGEARAGRKGIQPGVFTRNGKGLDDLASQLRDEGWDIPNDPVDGGVQALRDRIQAELAGEKQYSMADSDRLAAHEREVRNREDAQLEQEARARADDLGVPYEGIVPSIGLAENQIPKVGKHLTDAEVIAKVAAADPQIVEDAWAREPGQEQFIAALRRFVQENDNELLANRPEGEGAGAGLGESAKGAAVGAAVQAVEPGGEGANRIAGSAAGEDRGAQSQGAQDRAGVGREAVQDVGDLRAKLEQAETKYSRQTRMDAARGFRVGLTPEALVLRNEADAIQKQILEIERPAREAEKARVEAEHTAQINRQSAERAQRVAALPVAMRRNGWEIVRDDTTYALLDPATKEEVYRGKLGRVKEVADESPPTPARPDLALKGETPEELTARAAEAEAAAKADAAAAKARDEADRVARERKEIAQRSGAIAGEDFLTPTEAVAPKTQKQIDAKRAEDQLAGQGDVFSQPTGERDAITSRQEQASREGELRGVGQGEDLRPDAGEVGQGGGGQAEGGNRPIERAPASVRGRGAGEGPAAEPSRPAVAGEWANGPEPGARSALGEQPEGSSVARVAEIDAELEKLQEQYEKKLKGGARNGNVPPSIKADALKSITNKMDKLDAEKAALQGKASGGKGGPDVPFKESGWDRVEPKPRAVTFEDAVLAVEPLERRLGKVVNVVDRFDELPQNIRDTAKQRLEPGHEQRVAGAFDPIAKRLYVIAENAASPEGVVKTALHELWHHGGRELLGEQMDPVMRQVYASKQREIAQSLRSGPMRNYRIDVKTDAGRVRAADEFIARLAETEPTHPLVMRVIAAVRRGLRKLGLDVKMSDNDIVDLIRRSRGALEERAGSGEPQFQDRPERAAEEPAAKQVEEKRKGIYKRVASGIVDRIDQAFNPLGKLPKQDLYLAERGLAQGVIEEVNDSAKSISKMFHGASEADKKALFEYLTTKGATTDAIVNPLLRKVAENTKAMIDEMGDKMVKRGMLSQESRDQYKGSYLPRLYLKHLLNEADWKALGTGRKPSDMGYLKQRKDIPEEVRKVLLGEIQDPGYLAAVAIAKPARDMALLDWLKQISEKKEWALPASVMEYVSGIGGKKTRSTPFWLKEEATQLRKQAEYYTPENKAKALEEAQRMDTAADKVLDNIQSDLFDQSKTSGVDFKQIPNTARYGKLRGMFVREEIYNDLMGVNDFLPTNPGWFQNIFGYGGAGTKATQVWKTMKVAMNPPGQVRNLISNGVLMQLSGVPLSMVPVRWIQAAKEITGGGAHYEIAKKHGVRVSTFSAQELGRLKTALLDLEAKERSTGALGRMHHIGSTIMDKAGDLYQFSETLGKTAMIIDGMERQGMTERQAVNYAQKWLFDYSLVGKNVRYARSAPVGIPFATFQVKVLPRLVEVALEHPQRFLPWIGLFYGLPMLTAYMSGVDSDDLDKLKKAMPEWLQDKGHALIMPWKDEQGRWQVVDLGYFMPWANWTEIAGDIASGQPGKAVKAAGIFSGPLTDIITAIKTGKDPFTGRDIYAAGDPPGAQAAAIVNYMWNMAAPPIFTDRGLVSPMGIIDKEFGGKAVQAIAGTTNKYGEPRATGTQAALAAFGVNTYGMTPEITRMQNIQRMNFEIKEVQTRLTQKLGDQSLSEKQKDAINNRYEDEIKRRSEKLNKYVSDSAIDPRLATQ